MSGCSRWNFADGLPETSNCYCHPGIAGGSPAYASLAHPHSVREHDLRYDRPETAEARRARQNQCPALGIAFASHRPHAHEWRLAAARLASARLANLRHRRGATMRGKTSAHRRNNPPYRRNSKRAHATHSRAPQTRHGGGGADGPLQRSTPWQRVFAGCSPTLRTGSQS